MSKASYSTLERPTGGAFDLLCSIYEDALPAAERKSRQALAAMMVRPDYRFIIVGNAGTIAGFAIVFISARIDVALLEYMAIDRRWRGAGLGKALYERATAEVLSCNSRSVLLIEVDSDRQDSPDRAMRSRRIAFYRRLGCRRIEGLNYILPLPGPAVPTMDLLVDGPVGDSVPRETLRLWLSEIYTSVYGCTAEDPRIMQMLAGDRRVYDLV